MTDTVPESEKPKKGPLFFTKMAAKFVVGSSVKATVVGVVRHNTTPESRKEEVSIAIGAFVLGSMVADHAKVYTGQRIDHLVKLVKEAQEKAAELEAAKESSNN